MKAINIEEVFHSKKTIFIDVRSPSEYNESTIPGAFNVPLFSDKERKEIGTLYHDDKDSAYEKGFEIGTSKLYSIYRSIKTLFDSNDYKIIIFCWRGGMRSKSIALNLKMSGMNVYQLKGGYKAYRKFVLEGLEAYKDSFTYYTLHGNTGVGKTILLHELEKMGEPVLDLEGLANNRGSMFGNIGLGRPINQKMFDSLLFEKLINNKRNYFFIESESKRIGNIMLPDFLFTAMDQGNHVLLHAKIDQRIENLIEEYLPIQDKESIVQLIMTNKFFQKNKGRQWVDHLLSLLYEDDYYNFIKQLLLEYYDPLYSYSENKYEPYDFVLSNDNIQECMGKLILFVPQNNKNTNTI